MESLNIEEENVSSFTWKVKQGAKMVPSPCYRVGHVNWRGVWKGHKVFLQLESSIHSKTIKARLELQIWWNPYLGPPLKVEAV